MAKQGSAKNWFMTINKSAKCYDKTEQLLRAIEGLEFWALIKHKSDDDTKGEHLHAVLSCAGRKTLSFEELQEAFEGCHLEQAAHIESTTAYLTHSTYTAREQGKEPYSLSDVITNNERLLEDLTIRGSKEPFNPDKMLKYINEGCESEIDFYQRFGGEAFKDWNRTYKNLREAWLQQNRTMKKEYLKDRTIHALHTILSGASTEKRAIALIKQTLNDYEDGVFPDEEELMKEVFK